VHCIKEWRLQQQNNIQNEIKLSNNALDQPEYGMDMVKSELSETKHRVA
jgi:hypothetical protein